jgi:hypothetical protein
MALRDRKISGNMDPCGYREHYRTYRKRYRACGKHCRWIRLHILVAALSAGLIPLAHATQQNSPARATEQSAPRSEAAGIDSLMARVGPPSQEAVDEFKKAGMEDVKPHALTAAERAKVEAALASLPALNRDVLEKKLHYLAFVDGIPGEGTGLTSPAGKTGQYDITLRASIVDESLSTFLTTKEHRVFTDDGSGDTVTIKGTGTDALTYVLLHESTHVVDKSCGITTDPHSRFTGGIWTSQREMVPALASSLAATTYFRGGHPIGVGKATAVYDALAETPFVSLYATATEQEDFAELVAWREILQQDHGDLVIEVNDAGGKSLGRWEPLTFPRVQKRFVDVDEFLVSPAACGGL